MQTFFGIYRGVVLSAVDPAGKGRVQVLVPSVAGQTSGWALPCRSGGAALTPKVGDTAWIMFEGGNPGFPVFMGLG